MSKKCLTILVCSILCGALPVAGESVPAGGSAAAEQVNEAEGPVSYLGVWLSDAVDGGAQIVDLVPSGPAELGGLQPGDIVVEANAKTISNQMELSRILRVVKPGATLDLGVLRDGKTLRKLVTTGDRLRSRRAVTSLVPVYRSSDHFGLEAVEITPELRQFYGAPGDAGVLVTALAPGKLAARAGIQVGDVLVRIDDTEITDPRISGLLMQRGRSAQGWQIALVREGVAKQLVLASPLDVEALLEQDRLERERIAGENRMRALQAELEQLDRRSAEIKRKLKELQEKIGQTH